MFLSGLQDFYILLHPYSSTSLNIYPHSELVPELVVHTLQCLLIKMVILPVEHKDKEETSDDCRTRSAQGDTESGPIIRCRRSSIGIDSNDGCEITETELESHGHVSDTTVFAVVGCDQYVSKMY